MRTLMVAGVAAVAGCATGPGGRVHDALAAYVEAADRADRTKTHATNEYPEAVKDMHLNEEVLRKECQSEAGRGSVRGALEDMRLDLDRRRQAAPAGEKERLQVQESALIDLKGRLGL